MCARCTKSSLSYRYRNVVNDMKKRLAIAFAAALVLLCSACGQNTDAVSEASSTPADPALVVSDSTDPSSQASSTTAGIPPTTETRGSDSSSGSGGSGSPAPNSSYEAGTTKPTSSIVPDKPTQAPQTDGSKDGTTSGTSAAGTTGKPQTTSTSRPTTSAAMTTTTAAAKSPWAYPYDVSEIIRECKAEIARVGLVWDDSLVGLPGRDGKPIGLPDGVSEADPSIDWAGWDQPENTVLYTTYPDGFTFGDYVFDGNLKHYIFGELIPFYLRNQERYSLKRCKIWFEPLPDCPGDYNIYFLYATS